MTLKVGIHPVELLVQRRFSGVDYDTVVEGISTCRVIPPVTLYPPIGSSPLDFQMQ
jgi:hypothetical protein